jgi:hypothetical protein
MGCADMGNSKNACLHWGDHMPVLDVVQVVASPRGVGTMTVMCLPLNCTGGINRPVSRSEAG